jgi:hypothetical protein
MAISVDGTTQGARQRVLAVPFAHQSSSSAFADALAPQVTSWRPEIFATTNAQWQNGIPRDATTLPFGPGMHGNWNVECTIPNSFSSLSSLNASYWMNKIYGNDSSTLSLKIIIVSVELSGFESVIFQKNINKISGDPFPGSQTIVIPASVTLNQNINYKLRIEMSNGADSVGLRDIKINGISSIVY